MKKAWIPILIAMVLFVHSLEGVVPQKWEVRSKDDFLRGKLDGISVSFDGVLSLSPKEKEIETPPEEFFLSILLSQDGVAYLGTGHGGKIYRIREGSEPELYFQVPEMDIYCLAQDRRGNLFAGTSPNGKVYKIADKDKGDVFFNPHEKYIWDLMFTEKGSLLAAVGENGGIYEINQQGEGSIIFKTNENHVLCLKEGTNGELIAGTGGKGLLYRIAQGKKAVILFESPYEEIKSIALDREGNIYAAAGGAVTQPKEAEMSPASLKGKADEIETEVAITVTPSSESSLERVMFLPQRQPGVLYKIDPNGMAKKLWFSNEELIYSLFWREEERKLIFGTGAKGRIYSIDRDEKVSLILQKKSEQVYCLLPFQSNIYMLSNNPSNLSIIYSEQKFEGEYTSHVLDSKTISLWGRIEWEAGVPGGTSLQFQTRSGNSSKPDETWNDWSPPYQREDGEKILSPRARFIQFKVLFKTQSAQVSPVLQEVSLFYLQANIAPVITRLTLLPSNEVYLKMPDQTEVIWGADVDFSEQAESKNKTKAIMVPKKVQRKGFQTIVWDAVDENDDILLYSVFIKREEEKQWRILKEEWNDAIYAFDTLTFPDGVYLVKVVVSDSPSNPYGMELAADKISSPLVIDNSLPVVKNFQAVKEKDKLTVTFLAEDSMSYIKEVEYLIRPEGWRGVFPVDGICDSKQESFNLALPLPPKFNNLITVKVKDSKGNVGVHRQSF